MPAPIVVPFNFEPINASVKTGSYTLPAGVYAKVTPLYGTYVVGGLSVTNGNGSKTYTEAEMSLSINSSAVYFYDLRGSGTVGRTTAGSSSYTINIPQSVAKDSYATISAGTVTGAIGHSIRADGQPLVSLAAAGAVSYDGFLNSIVASMSLSVNGTVSNSYWFSICFKNEKNSFWVDAGSVLNSPANCFYYVEEYNKIS